MVKQFFIAITLIVCGSLLAAFIQTDRGQIEVRDVRFDGAAGNLMSGLLYVPARATAAAPAPGILAIHGYINTRETQSGFAIELARRGFVVLALDQTGHGYSAPPAFAHGFGGPDGLRYLRAQPYVDTSRIGLEGHSMGGWAVQMAAAEMPDAYQAMVLEGSSTGTFGAPDGTATSPRNLLLVFSLYDEFSELMWGSPVPSDIVKTQKLMSLFDTTKPVEVGKRYGDVNEGTARQLAMPPVTHPGDHLSREAIAEAVNWFEEVLDQPAGIKTTSQTWYWKEFATLIALFGFGLLILPVFNLVMRLPPGQAVKRTQVEIVELSFKASVVALLLTFVLPIALFFPVQTIANLVLPASAILPQQITNGVLLWAWTVGLISFGILLFHLRRSEYTLRDIGMPLDIKLILNALLVAIVSVLLLYLVVAVIDEVLLVDFRFWVVALKTMNLTQFLMFLVYLPLFSLFFVVLSVTLHAHTRATSVLYTALQLGSGYIVLLVAQYVPLFAGGTLLISSQPLLTIVALQFVPLMAMVGIVSTYCHRATNNIYPGAFINSLLITWYMVAGTATQAVPFSF